MIAYVRGEENSTIDLFKAGDDVVKAVIVSDAAVPLDITGDTLTLEVYDTEDRKNAVIASLAGTIAVATGGEITFTLADTQITFGPGKYYGFVKRSENVGSTIEFSRKPTILNIR
jgi:hypothetical protein